MKSKFIIAGFMGFMFAKVTMIKTMNDRFLQELPYSDVSNLIRHCATLVHLHFTVQKISIWSKNYIPPTNMEPWFIMIQSSNE